MKSSIAISEIFGPTIQGEGALIGRPTVFVRTGGCDFRCSWCDTLYAVLPEFRSSWTDMTAGAVLERVEELSGGRPLLVTVSGGNPAMQPLGDLLKLGRSKGYEFALETQGSIAKDWFFLLDYLVLSPKPPSSGMAFDFEKLSRCVALSGPEVDVVLKIVVFDEADYLFARTLHHQMPALRCYLQPGNDTPQQQFTGDDHATVSIPGIAHKCEWLLKRVLEDNWQGVTILPQLHTLLWGNKRGV